MLIERYIPVENDTVLFDEILEIKWTNKSSENFGFGTAVAGGSLFGGGPFTGIDPSGYKFGRLALSVGSSIVLFFSGVAMANNSYHDFKLDEWTYTIK